MAGRFVVALGTVLALASPLRVAADTSVYEQVKPSLALVVRQDAKGLSFGTAFCVDHVGGHGVFLTNAHVAGTNEHAIRLLFPDDKYSYPVAIVRVAQTDAAVLLTSRDCPPMSLSDTSPPVGTPIAIAGFPAIQLALLLHGEGLSASYHLGTVSALAADGSLIEYDAMTDHGNSGSPLVDAHTGIVYGLVQAVNTGTTGALQNNLAISSPMLIAFLRNAHHEVVAAVGAEAAARAQGESAQDSIDVASADAARLRSAASTQLRSCYDAVNSEQWEQTRTVCLSGVRAASTLEASAPANSEEFFAGELAEGICGALEAVAVSKLGDRSQAHALARRSLTLIDDASSRTRDGETYKAAQGFMSAIMVVFDKEGI